MDPFKRSERINTVIGWAIVLIMALIVTKIVSDENKRDLLVTSEIFEVVEHGCVTSIYKGKPVYDCSVRAKSKKDGELRSVVLSFGVLPGDTFAELCYPTVGWAGSYCKFERVGK